jgi:hypothetical protein
MTVDAWLTSAAEDARRRGLEGLVPLLETLARSTRALRAADESARPAPGAEPPPQEAR